ncbi:GNAT family N-acetyltransferase [Chloroflexota bacterium]
MIEIVKAEEKHIPEIGDLWIEFMRFHADMDSVYQPPDDSIPIFIGEYLQPAMSDKNSLVLVALDGEQIIGYSYSLITEPHKLNNREKYGSIHDMFIVSPYRRSGIGMKMFNEIIKWFTFNNIKRIELDVMTQNQTASSFWEKLGFKDLNRTIIRQI